MFQKKTEVLPAEGLKRRLRNEGFEDSGGGGPRGGPAAGRFGG